MHGKLPLSAPQKPAHGPRSFEYMHNHNVVDGVAGKRCGDCKDWKPLSLFSKRRRSFDGLQYQCKPCKKRWIAAYRAQPGNAVKDKNSKRKRKYGLDEVSYLALFERQGNRCKICQTAVAPYTRSAHVDHRHVAGYEAMAPCEKKRHVRGILCINCNIALGQMKDDVYRLERAVEYLREFEHLP